MFLVAFFLLAVMLGPFPDSDVPAALATGFAGIAAMAIQNGVQRVHLATIPPTTLMTGNTTQATLDAIDLLLGMDGDRTIVVRTRFSQRSAPYFSLPRAVRWRPSFTLGLAFGVLRSQSPWARQASLYAPRIEAGCPNSARRL